MEELAEAVTYCHIRGVRVYLTVNTLVTDREMERAAELLAQAAVCGVDAFIVQDLGLVSLCHQMAPGVPVHASTQMSIHSLEGARQAVSVPPQPRRGRGVCPRRAVHVPLGAVLFLRRGGPAQRQPGPVRPAVPTALRLRPV